MLGLLLIWLSITPCPVNAEVGPGAGRRHPQKPSPALVRPGADEAQRPNLQPDHESAAPLPCRLRQVQAFEEGELISSALDFFLARPKSSNASQPAPIPKVLHHIFLDGEDAYERAVEAGERPGAKKAFRRQWRASCLEAHSEEAGWTHMFWDRGAAQRFLRAHHPWFLNIWLSYPMTVLQGDALRPFLMYTYGGLYLDLDIECFSSAESTLLGPSLVLQSEYAEGVDVVNSVMASAPGHAFWKVVVRLQLQKSVLPHRANIGWKDILDATGPLLYGEAFRHWTGLEETVGDHRVHNTHIRVMGLGRWFVPCQWWDSSCHQQTDAQLAAGLVPPGICGYHRYTASWRSLVKD